MSPEIESGDESQETVWWINRFPERGVRKIFEKMHIVPPTEVPASTHISVADIDQIQDKELRESLKKQLEDVRQSNNYIEVPVVHMPIRELSHSWLIATKSNREYLDERLQVWRKHANE